MSGQSIDLGDAACPFAYYEPCPQSSLRLFCFPYAGSGTIAFQNWHSRLSPEIEVCPIVLPGRAQRSGELLVSHCLALAATLAEDLKCYLDKPFAFFGHSMGALLAFEIARYLRQKSVQGPVRLFVSGFTAPQLLSPRRKLFDLPEERFLAELCRLGVFPPQVLQNPEKVRNRLPMLRADFSVVENYEYVAGAPLDCPITAYAGLQDKITKERIDAWSSQTSSGFSSQSFPGEHFFIHSAEHLLLEALRTDLILHDQNPSS